jgi:hypothetical protein
MLTPPVSSRRQPGFSENHKLRAAGTAVWKCSTEYLPYPYPSLAFATEPGNQATFADQSVGIELFDRTGYCLPSIWNGHAAAPPTAILLYEILKQHAAQ